ncbi:Phage minor structural protein GP20 [compost metagenome]
MDVTAIKADVENWKTKHTTDTENLKSALAKKDYEVEVDRFLGGYKFTTNLAQKAVRDELITKELKIENGKILGADDYIKTLQESDPDAFVVEGKATPKFTSKDTGKKQVEKGDSTANFISAINEFSVRK